MKKTTKSSLRRQGSSKWLLVITYFFSLVSTSTFAQVPDDLKERLLSKTWHGYIKNSESTSNSRTNIELDFILDENKTLRGTITLFNFQIGNGHFNFTRFAEVSYDTVQENLSVSFWPPGTAKDTIVWILKSTQITDQYISGLYLEQPFPEKPDFINTLGTFRIE